MDYRLPFVLLLFCMNSAFADFSTARFKTHPIEPAGDRGPYIIEVTGEWPSDCHPGEQKPVIREFTGETALVEFETIVEHVTCNDVATPYRVLIDMSDVIEPGAFNMPGIELTLRFGGTEYTKLVDLLCICSPAPIGPDIKPEPGIYEGAGLEKQGILLARQNDRMGAYPLIYDEAGNSQWLFGGGGIVEDVYFVKLKELSGGQCLGCPPPADPPQKEVVGKLTMLVDTEGVIQVKVNDGLFNEYRQVEFGYGEFVSAAENEAVLRFPDLSGRWAIADLSEDSPQEAPAEPLIPLVFDVAFESENLGPCFPVCLLQDLLSYTFSIHSIEGTEVARMECWNVPDDKNELELICDVNNPDISEGTKLFEARQLSLERMIFDYIGPIIPDISDSNFTAVRVD